MGPRDSALKVVPEAVLGTAAKGAVTSLPCAAFTPHDADPAAYLSAREDCWNKACKNWPSVIALPTSVAEVQALVKTASIGKNNIAVLSGGHSPM